MTTVQLTIDPASHEPEEFKEKAGQGVRLGADLNEDYEIDQAIRFRPLGGFESGHFVATCALAIDETRISCCLNGGVVTTDKAEFTLGSVGATRGHDECSDEFLQTAQSLVFSL